MSVHDDDSDFDEALDKTSVIQSETFKVRLAKAGQAPPCLVLLVGPPNYVGRQWAIEDTDRILGREETSHIHVGDKSMSKSHAKLALAGGEVSIIDLESTNKTIVNGEILPSLIPRVLKNNDQIKMGNVIFKFLERGNIETVSVAETFDRGLTDALTGIANKGSFNAKAADSFRKSELLGAPLSLVTFDIDHFKLVNDTYGHSAGDYVLKELSRVVRERVIRGDDFFARTGGEEFTLLFLGSTITHSQDVAERIRQTIEAHKFEFQGVSMVIRISVGVSAKREGDRTWEDVFERADKALYTSKTTGRNKVTVDT